MLFLAKNWRTKPLSSQFGFSIWLAGTSETVEVTAQAFSIWRYSASAFFCKHLAYLKPRIERLDSIGQENELAWRILSDLPVEFLRIGNTRNGNAA
jgi:hypothetical protein